MDYRCSGMRYEDDDEDEDIGNFHEKKINPTTDKGAAKRGTPHTRGTAISFGFRRRPTSGIPMPITSQGETVMLHPRSKSAGSEQDRRHDDDNNAYGSIHNTSSGRSTPRLVPPKKEASGIAVRTNRFGFRQTQAKFSNKVGDICPSHNSNNTGYYSSDKPPIQQQAQQHLHRQTQENQREDYGEKSSVRMPQSNNPSTILQSKVRLTSSNSSTVESNVSRRGSGIPEPVTRYTLHTSHLPQPQYAVRMSDANSKIAKTVVNQSRKVSPKDCANSKDGSGTEDSGIGSQRGYVDDREALPGGRGGVSRHRNLKMIVSGKSFDVRDVQDDDSTVTEISVIQLPKIFVNPNTTNTGLVRERATQYQRVLNKDNRYTDSMTSMSTTSSEGYDEGLGEEKVYKDRSRSEKIPSIKSDFSPPSSDDPEYGHGEAMADEYSLSSSDECQRLNSIQQLKTVTNNVPKNGTLPKSNNVRSVFLTIEDPAFAAVAATSTTLIDDETSPVDSLFDSPTASITVSDGKNSKKERNDTTDQIENNIDDESPGTPTNASNSLSLSEGREYFDDEIADQPGLMFNDRTGPEGKSGRISQATNENSHTLVESNSKPVTRRGNSIENSPLNGRKISRTGSIDTLSPCESIASDDLMLDYERSETNSYEESHSRLDSSTALHELDETTILSELENQGEEVMRQWSSLLGTSRIHQMNSNSTNNNVNSPGIIDNNNHPTSESGIASGRTSRLLRSRSGTDSPRSLDNARIRQVGSPLRTPRSAQSPSLDSGDESSLRIERGTYQYMFQDIVSIKTMLLKLKRVLQEAETLNPFDNSNKNGLFFNLNEGDTTDLDTSSSRETKTTADELVDLRRQVVFLQGQLQDRDRTIQTLQFQMSKLGAAKGNENQNYSSSGKCGDITSLETCNAATQTEKIRPISSGPSLLQSLPQEGNMGPLVSWSDIRNHQNLTTAGMSLPEMEPKKNQHNSHYRTLKPPLEETSKTSELQNGYKDNTESDYLSAIILEPVSGGKTVDINDTRQDENTAPEEIFLKKSYIPNVRNIIRTTTTTTLKQVGKDVSIIDQKYTA